MYSWKPCMPSAKCQAACRISGHVELISHGRHSHVAICMNFTGHLQIDVTERHSRPGAFFLGLLPGTRGNDSEVKLTHSLAIWHGGDGDHVPATQQGLPHCVALAVGADDAICTQTYSTQSLESLKVPSCMSCLTTVQAHKKGIGTVPSCL